MDPETAAHYAGLILLAQAAFTQVEYSTDATPERFILRLQARYGRHRIFVTELVSQGVRKYQYYVLSGNWIEAGFDNSPDPRALRLKYGRVGEEYVGELIPHLHRENKTLLFLTEGMTFSSFTHWLQSNIPPN